MSLPTVLMTDVIRSAQQGNAHGGAYLINMQTGEHTKVLDWNRIDIDWAGRGMGRGLRGIVFREGEIWIAASDELFVFDQAFNILRSYKCPALHHCHEISLDDSGRVWLTSTSFDALLRFDPVAERFDRGLHIAPVSQQGKGRTVAALGATEFDPNDPGRFPPKQDRLHINQVWWTPEGVLFSGLRLQFVCAVDESSLRTRPFAVVPETTHNCQPHEGRVVFNSTGDDAVVIAGVRGRVIRRMAIPKVRATGGAPGDFARAGFARGLCVDDAGGSVLVGHSPGSVSAFDLATGDHRRTVTVTDDVRNAPHGLAVWPFTTA